MSDVQPPRPAGHADRSQSGRRGAPHGDQAPQSCATRSGPRPIACSRGRSASRGNRTIAPSVSRGPP
eukprot:15429406-Alexandrium_andersonii.AAC.1